jgi:hypothetical protein
MYRDALLGLWSAGTSLAHLKLPLSEKFRKSKEKWDKEPRHYGTDENPHTSPHVLLDCPNATLAAAIVVASKERIRAVKGSFWRSKGGRAGYYGSLRCPGSDGSLKEEWMKTRPMQPGYTTWLCRRRRRTRDAPCKTSVLFSTSFFTPST